MKIHEEIEKASAILKLSAKERREYLRRIEYSNSIHDCEDICQELLSMLLDHMEKNNLENDESTWRLIDIFRTTQAFYYVINYDITPSRQVNKNGAFCCLRNAAGACEKWLLDYPESQNIIYTGFATTNELEKMYLEKFGENIEFDPEDRVDEDTLSELVDPYSDLLYKSIFVIGYPF